ncbi:MAG: hypothetical protein K5924_01355 [Chloroflexi bacterium]|nr:hypothetical protein [Chloroflexota bacterium]
MDDLPDRYERLVATWNAGRRDGTTLAWITDEAASLAADAPDGWYRVMATGLAAAARVAGGGDLDVLRIIDATPPPADPGVVERLEELLPGGGTLADRLAAHDVSSIVPPESLAAVAERIVALLHARAAEDLDLAVGVGPPTIEIATASQPSGLVGDRVVLAVHRPWAIGKLLRVLREAAIPGGYLASRLRPPGSSWWPGPQSTVDHGMWTVGPEVLLGDHELAHEIGRIGRTVGLRWSGERIVAVGRARDDLAAAYAAVALAGPQDVAALRGLGASDDDAARLLARWTDPLARVEAAARAAGPPLVRGWLVRVGQTVGLARLLTERLTPSDLRAESSGG